MMLRKLLILTISLNKVVYVNNLGRALQKEQVSLSLSKDLIRLVDRRRGRASRSAEIEYLIKLGLEHDNDHDNEEVK
jgi:hypothetical protein